MHVSSIWFPLPCSHTMDPILDPLLSTRCSANLNVCFKCVSNSLSMPSVLDALSTPKAMQGKMQAKYRNIVQDRDLERDFLSRTPAQ